MPSFLELTELPSTKTISSLAQTVCEVLSSDNESYRPLNCMGEPGSLLDFTKDSFSLPTILVPDIHARPDFIKNILNCRLPKKFCGQTEEGKKYTVLQALEKKLIQVVCVGDAIHTELYAARWKLISLEFEKGDCAGFFMQQEMILCLSTLCTLMELKCKFPQNFHFLKGNHENILNCSFGGDFAFCKYANEGEMVKLFMQEQYGEKVLNLIAKYENLLPLMVAGKNFVVSHAEPAEAFSREQIIDAKYEDNVVQGLIWTRNGQVKEPTAAAIMIELLGKQAAKKSFYFAGHRPVKENYATRQDGKLIQIHNPKKQNIFLIHTDRKFNFKKDIINTKRGVRKNEQ